MKKIIFTCSIIIVLYFAYFLQCSLSPVKGINLQDGWSFATPESQGINPVPLQILTEQINNNRFGEISSLLIARNGKLVYEEYFHGARQSDLHNVYSVTKSVTSVLVGIALEEGKISSLQDKVYPYFNEYDEFQNMTSLKDSITIEHLLQMRAGFLWQEYYVPYSDPSNSFRQMYHSDDLVKYVLDQPLSDRPGSTFVYNTGASMVLGGILRNQYGYSVEELTNRVLFKPLGITIYEWRQQLNGFIPTGTGLTLMSRDMAKFGQLCLQDGIWNGDTLIPQGWLEKSHQAYTNFTSGNGYGYHWWLRDISTYSNEKLVPEAMGWGNQYVIIFKDLDMVVVSTAENRDNFTQFIYDILNMYIIPSVN